MFTYNYREVTSEGVLVDIEIKNDLLALYRFIDALASYGMELIARNSEGVIIQFKEDETITSEIRENIQLLDASISRNDTRITVLEAFNNAQTKIEFPDEEEDIGTEMYLMYDLLPDELKQKLKIYIKKRKK